MAEIEDRTVTTERTTETVPVQDTDTTNRNPDASRNVAVQVIWFVEAVIVTLLGLRFFFRLFGANPANPIADFIYTVSHPFVAPFFGLFSYNENLANGRFEFETLVAIIVYSLIAWLLVRLVTIGRR